MSIAPLYVVLTGQSNIWPFSLLLRYFPMTYILKPISPPSGCSGQNPTYEQNRFQCLGFSFYITGPSAQSSVAYYKVHFLQDNMLPDIAPDTKLRLSLHSDGKELLPMETLDQSSRDPWMFNVRSLMDRDNPEEFNGILRISVLINNQSSEQHDVYLAMVKED